MDRLSNASGADSHHHSVMTSWYQTAKWNEEFRLRTTTDTSLTSPHISGHTHALQLKKRPWEHYCGWKFRVRPIAQTRATSYNAFVILSISARKLINWETPTERKRCKTIEKCRQRIAWKESISLGGVLKRTKVSQFPKVFLHRKWRVARHPQVDFFFKTNL